MTKEEINKAIEEIRGHCRNNSCQNCEAYTVHGCAFMSSYPNAWLTIIEADKEESENK